MARRADGVETKRRARTSAVRRRRARIGRAAAVLAVAAVAVFLYYRPISGYVETRADLAARRAEVSELRRERARLQRRHEASTSLAAVGREARQIGYVRPGERMFIVKGIPSWRRAHVPAK